MPGTRRPRGTITLVEESSELAPGASGKAGGFLAVDWHGAATASLAELSYRLHGELAKAGNGKDRWGFREVEVGVHHGASRPADSQYFRLCK